MPGWREAGQRLPLAWLEEQVELPLPLQKPLQISHQQCPGGPGFAPHRPRRAQCDIQQIAVGDRSGVVGLLDFDELALAAQKQFVGPEGE